MLQQEDDEAFEASLRNPPAAMVLRDYSGRIVSTHTAPRRRLRR